MRIIAIVNSSKKRKGTSKYQLVSLLENKVAPGDVSEGRGEGEGDRGGDGKESGEAAGEGERVKIKRGDIGIA